MCGIQLGPVFRRQVSEVRIDTSIVVLWQCYTVARALDQIIRENEVVPDLVEERWCIVKQHLRVGHQHRAQIDLPQDSSKSRL